MVGRPGKRPRVENSESQTTTPIPQQAQPPSWPFPAGASQPGFSLDPVQMQQAINMYQQMGFSGQIPYSNGVQHQTQQQASTSQSQTSGGGGGGTDTQDVASLNDALGSAGVDLRAEAENLQRTTEPTVHFRQQANRSRKQALKPAFDMKMLGAHMRTLAGLHRVNTVTDDSVNYLALALRVRLQELITAMIAASHHRTQTHYEVDTPPSLYEDGTPMWNLVVRRDVGKQVAALAKAEQEDETRVRRERKEREDKIQQHAAALAQMNGREGSGSGGGEDDEMDGKKKKKKEGPGVAAKNMSEEVRKKMSNAVANSAAGISTAKYAWMNAGASGSAALAKKKEGTPAPATSGSSGPTSSGWMRPYQGSTSRNNAAAAETPPAQEMEVDTRQVVTRRDAMFVIQRERGHGGGRGAARGWT